MKTNFIRQIFHCRKSDHIPKTKFDNIINFARSLENKNPMALVDLVRALLRPLQAKLLLSAIENELHGAQSEVESEKFFISSNFPKNILDFKYPQLAPEQFEVQLNRDPVLPCPWHRDHYVGTLSTIGLDKPNGVWKEDTTNHHIKICLPWGIVFITGGNHSIATGILGGEGMLKPSEVCDMRKLLELAQCDGKHYRLAKTGDILEPVRDYRVAAIFEIGRLMLNHHITPMLAHADYKK